MSPRSLQAASEALQAALRGDEEAATDAVTRIDEEDGRVLWSSMRLVQELIEGMDGGTGERPWDVGL